MCSLGELTDFKNEKPLMSVFHLSRTQLLLTPAIIFIMKHLSTGDRFQLLSLSPVYLLPQVKREGLSFAEPPMLTLVVMVMLPEPPPHTSNNGKPTNVRRPGLQGDRCPKL